MFQNRLHARRRRPDPSAVICRRADSLGIARKISSAEIDAIDPSLKVGLGSSHHGKARASSTADQRNACREKRSSQTEAFDERSGESANELSSRSI
jgi:hypothetical protein